MMNYKKTLLFFLLLLSLIFQTSYAQNETLRLLVVGDPFAIALQNAEIDLETQYGVEIDLEVVGYNDVRQIILTNAQDQVSNYDLVSFDVLWMGELAQTLLPLDARIAEDERLHPEDFLQVAYQGSSYEGFQYGLPIQPHPELLWYRRDVFDEAQVEPPRTTDEVLAVAQKLNDPASGQYGICWNAQRRQPLGQQMAHFYGAFGQPLLDENGQPTLDTPLGLEAAEYALDLLAYSPPDILNMAWDQRILRFSQGGCAMTYGWGARSPLVETTASSRVAGLVGYLPAPHAPKAAPVTPLGTWSLGIPANIGDRADLAWDFLAWLSSAEVEITLAEAGNGGMPRRSVIEDPNLRHIYPAFEVVSLLEQSGELGDWMRPAIPEWAELEIILGTVFHDMLRGELSASEAIQLAQSEAEVLFNHETDTP